MTPLYSIATWDGELHAFAPHPLSVPAFNITRKQLVVAMRELKAQGYSCHRVRDRDGEYDSDPSVLIERTDGAHPSVIQEGWKR